MAFNKAKLVDNAQKFLHQGKIAQAIIEYQQILKHEPKDQVTLMTIGDLFVRQGETFQALEYFERLANIFLADGFVTKAIAIYKKIAKLAPEETRPVERLAELYVQQGVLSEARPIYLQLAELHQRAGRQTQAAALLRKLLEAEPDNLRVQTRLAELSLTMNQPGEAAAAFRAAADQSQRRGDHGEAIKYAERALSIDGNDGTALTLKAKALAAAGRKAEAVSLLALLPQIEAGGETAQLLLQFHLESGDTPRAVELAAKIFAHDPRHFAAAHQVAVQLLEAGDTNRALTLLDLIREAMTDAGEHEGVSQALIRAAEQAPTAIEPREWLVDLYGRTSDSFRMPDALASLAQAYERTGRLQDAKQTFEKLLDRDSENESARRECERLQTQLAGGAPPKTAPAPVASVAAAPVPPNAAEEDDATQRFIAQALTDVDLFSSYGLTQKAIDLLEVVLEKVPDHAATLERLLDLHLGAGNESRTAELAGRLEEIYRGRDDSAAAERFAELRRRFKRAAAQSTDAVTAAPPATPVPEFLVPPEPAAPEPLADTTPLPAEPEVVAVASDAAVHEVDLSEEWAALVDQLATADAPGHAQEAATPAPFPELTQPEALNPAEGQMEAEPITASAARISHDVPQPQPVPVPEFTLELASAPSNGSSVTIGSSTENGPSLSPALDVDNFLQELSSELDAALPSLAAAEPPPRPPREVRASVQSPAKLKQPTTPVPVAAGPLSEVFDEFRAEFGEIGAEDEDLETHYNLGIAYREMGLLEEAISEFQRVAKGAPNGQTFRYAMQCCTLLGLAFMEKGQPAIAAMWYERALQTPGLDHESILALRYDLGVAQELAGDLGAARKSFSQVYGMNIDYRDVAERLASLGKGQ